MLTKSHPKEAKELLISAQEEVMKRWKLYEQMAAFDYSNNGSGEKKEN